VPFFIAGRLTRPQEGVKDEHASFPARSQTPSQVTSNGGSTRNGVARRKFKVAMPVSPMTPPTPASAGKPQPGQASQMKQPPMGQSSATQPTSNRGSQAQALQQVAAAIKFLEQAMSSVGAASELGAKIHDALGKLIKISPAGSSSPAGEKNAMQNAMMQQAQQNKAMQAMRAQSQGGGGGPVGGAAAGAAPGGQGMAA